MTEAHWVILFITGLCCFCAGTAAADWNWRSRGDHDYMNRKYSWGKLYIVKREEPDATE